MNPKAKTALIALLALTTVGSAGLAWQQYRALTSLRNESGGPDRNNADLQRRLVEAEHRAHDLENELAALRTTSAAETSSDNNDAPPPPPSGIQPNPGNRGPRPGFVALNALMDNPDFIQLVNTEEKSRLDGRYASLFKELSSSGTLTPQQIEAFKDLLVEKQNAARDTMMAARTNGITDRAEIRQLVQNAQAEVDKQIQSQLGDATYQQYKNYEQTLPQRNLVNQLSQRLSYSAFPLDDSQSKQLVQILAETSTKNTSTRAAGFQGGPGAGGGNPGGTSSARITDAAVARAQTILSTAQLQALVALQQQQDAQKKIMEMLRATRQTPASPGSKTSPATKAK